MDLRSERRSRRALNEDRFEKLATCCPHWGETRERNAGWAERQLMNAEWRGFGSKTRGFTFTAGDVS
jgi:hypothetical protein